MSFNLGDVLANALLRVIDDLSHDLCIFENVKFCDCTNTHISEQNLVFF